MDQDVGRLLDGTKVVLYLSDRAVYLVDEPGRVQRLSYGAISSILNARFFEVLTSGAETFGRGVVTSRPILATDLAHGVAVDVVRTHLSAMCWYRRDVIIGGEPYVFAYNPWRQGATAAWTVGVPEQPQVEKDVLQSRLRECVGMVEAFGAGVEPGPEWSAVSVPKSLAMHELLDHWMRTLGVTQQADLVLAASSEAVSGNDVAVLALAPGGVWVVDINLDGWAHPQPQLHAFEGIEIGSVEPASLCPITVKEPGRNVVDCVSYFITKDSGAEVFLNRLRTVKLDAT